MDVVFQYSNAEIRTKCENSIFIIRRAARTILTGVVTIGTELIAVKKVLNYTQFTPWLEANFNWSCATAENYMNATRAVKQYPLKAPLYSLQTLYLLTSQLPQEVKDEIMQTPVTFNEARLIISEHKAVAWKEAVELAIPTDPGAALREIERALENDPGLREAAAELMRQNAEKFALLSAREPKEILMEAGLTLEEQYPGNAKVRPILHPSTAASYQKITILINDKQHTLVMFPDPDCPIAEAAQNAAIRAVCKGLNIDAAYRT